MKKRILALLLSIVLVLGLVTVSFAANGTGHKISVKIYKVVLDSSKPLGYQNPELINTITVTCQDSTGHSGYNHSANLKDFYPTNVGAATTDWTGWEFASYYTKGQEQKPFYNWIRDTVNATANVTGSEPYPCSKNFYLVYKDTTPSVDTYTVTYTDGVDGEVVFPDQVTSGLTAGTATPPFQGGTPTREGYVFAGWKPAVAGTVTGNATYVAQWKVDMNGSGVPDDEEMKYTVTYTDGVANGAAFAEQKHPDLLPGTPTPAWEGVTDKPYWEGHVFIRWEPTVAPTVTDDVTYVAQWKDDKNGNGTPDDEETKYTVTYTDGVEGEEVFKDQVYGGLLSGEATPKFDGREPARKGYIFAGWKPAVADTVTGNVTYVAQWKDDRNSNSVPDDEETKYTVTYTDGVENEEIFKDQVYEGLLSGEATPKFEGKEPTRKGYVFAGWKLAVADTVTGNATYVAQWKKLDAAQTGDTTNLTVWYCLLGAAGMCFVAAFVLAKKKQSDK